MVFEFTIEGVPVPKGRPRTRKKGRPYTPEKTVVYENLVKLEYKAQNGSKFDDDATLHVDMQLIFPVPKRTSKKLKERMLNREVYPTKKPDIDNCIKAILDALNGIAYRDDTQVVSISAIKVYGDVPKAVVKLADIE